MIQLASDPNASRTQAWRPEAAEAHGPALQRSPGRSGHAWPFISREAEKPAAPSPAKASHNDSGS